MRARCLALLGIWALAGSLTGSAPATEAGVTPELRDRAVGELRGALERERDWVRVHAAEALLRNGFPEGVAAVYEPLMADAPPKHRIGVWRVLAQAQTDPAAREPYVARIHEAFFDLDGPDRLHAAETLGKLGFSTRSTALLMAAVDPDKPIAAYARLILANSGALEDADFLAALLGSYDEPVRTSTGYALRFVPRLSPKALATVSDAASREAEGGSTRLHLAIAWYVHAAADAKTVPKQEVLKYLEAEAGMRYQVGEALALCGGVEDLPHALRLLEDADADVRISGANAILSIGRRQSR